MISLARAEYPWKSDEIAYVARRKREGARHKIIAREVGRTPRSIDQLLHRLEKEIGQEVLELHREEELALLERLVRENAGPLTRARLRGEL